MAAKAKAKMPAINVPQTDAEADALLREYGTKSNLLARYNADMDDALAKTKAEVEANAAPIKTRLSEIEKCLAAWAGAHRDRLTEGGKSKTVTLPAGKLVWRSNPKSVSWPKALKAADIIANVSAKIREWKELRTKEAAELAATAKNFIRTKVEPNKEAMLEHEAVALKIDGVRIASSGEEFCIEPFGAELAEQVT